MIKHPTFFGACALTACLITFSAWGHDGQIVPTDHAPIGVMGDHLHKKGSWMVGYRYKQSHTSGYKDGSDDVTNASVMASYGEIAAKMDMGMHMVEIMYGLTDGLTLMLMPQYMQMSMLHQSSHGGGHTHRHEVEGMGDTELSGLYSLYDSMRGNVKHQMHVNVGVSLPTGSIDETFTNHHGVVYRMPYNMQFGTGTFDPILGLTYAVHAPSWSFGVQTMNYIRMGKNDHGYRQGNKYTATTWVARNITDFASVSFRLEGQAWDDVSGQDASLPVIAIVGADPDLQSGQRVMAHVGVNLLAGKNTGVLSGQRLSAEFGMPLYEYASGPQPETDYQLTLGWQWAF